MKNNLSCTFQIEMALRMVNKGKLLVEVCGKSMEPTYFSGDKVHIVSATEVCKGDIIYYWNENRYVIHRVMFNHNGLLLTKGDNNKYIDDYNPNIIVIGKVDNQFVNTSPTNEMDIIYVFWNEEEYQECKEFGEKLGKKIVHANKLFDNGINIAISAAAVERVGTISEIFCEGEKIYVHIGVRISDHIEPDFVLDSCFDFIIRSGDFLTCHYLNVRERFTVLLSEINNKYEGC